jgi:hypothetical protein
MELAMKCNDLSHSLVAFDQNSTLVAVVELVHPLFRHCPMPE